MGATEIIARKYQNEYDELLKAITEVNAEVLKTKEGLEKTNTGKLLYAPKLMNKAIQDDRLYKWGWHKKTCSERIQIDNLKKRQIRTMEMDAEKNGLGVEIQFGKYAFVPFDLFVKMVIFRDRGLIEVGIEVVAMKIMARLMSSGVAIYEQHYSEVKMRGEKPEDAPFLLMGIAPQPWVAPVQQEFVFHEEIDLAEGIENRE